MMIKKSTIFAVTFMGAFAIAAAAFGTFSDKNTKVLSSVPAVSAKSGVRLLQLLNETDHNETDYNETDYNETDHNETDHDEHDDHDDNETDHDEHDDHDDNETDHDEHDDHDDNETDHDDHSDEAGSGGKPWGKALAAGFAVASSNFIGVLCIVPVITLVSKNSSAQVKSNVMNIMLPAFACGALIASALFLILPEALHLLENGHAVEDDEHAHRMLAGDEEDAPSDAEVAAKFGVSILGGYFIPFVLGSFFPHTHHTGGHDHDHDHSHFQGDHDHDHDGHHGKDETAKSTAGKEVDEGTDEQAGSESNSSSDSKPKEINYALAATILAGDFFHNFCDGVFIGAAFSLCDNTLAWTVTAATIIHELAQELADFFLLTNQVGLSIITALALNIASGMSVVVGVVIILLIDMDDPTIGVLLCLSAGVYFYVAFSEIAPLVNGHATNLKLRALALLMWVAGALPIGLVLLKHEHC